MNELWNIFENQALSIDIKKKNLQTSTLKFITLFIPAEK